MHKLSIKTLLYLMMGFTTMALVIPLVFVVFNQNKEIHLLEHEKIGTAIIPKMEEIKILLAQHRGTANMYLNGNRTVMPRLQELARQVQHALNNTQQSCVNSETFLQPSCLKFEQLNNTWQILHSRYPSLSATNSFTAHTQLIADVSEVQISIADATSLSLDNVLSTYYLMNNMIRTLPELMEKLGQLRGFGSGLLSQQKITANEKIELTKLAYAVHLAVQNEFIELKKIFTASPEIKQHLQHKLETTDELIEKLLTTTQEKIIATESASITDTEFFAQASNVINHTMGFYQPIVATLNNELNKRIALLENYRNITIAIFVIFNLFVIGFISSVIRRINLPLKNAINCFKEIESGHYDYPIEIIYQDEIGSLLHSLDLMRQRLADYVEQLQQVVNSLAEAQRIAKIGNWDWDINTDKLSCSEEVFQIFDVNKQSFQPRLDAFLQKLPEDGRAKVKAVIDNALKLPGSYLVDYRIYGADSKEKIISQHIETKLDQDGKPSYLVGIVQDVTERKQAEQALKESEERWKFAIEGAGDGVWDWNIATGKVVYSKLWKAMIGYTEEEISDDLQEWVSRSHPDEIQMVNQCLEDYFSGKVPNYNCESRLRCKNGSWKWILDRGMVVSWDEAGKPLRMIGIHTDITERKRIEHALTDAKIAAEQANQAKSDFLANMSHEIRTPMNAILGFSSILSDLVTDPIQNYYLDAINKSGRTLLQLINDILDLSKIEAGKFTLQYTVVSIKTLLDEIRIIFSQKLNEKSITFSINIAEDVPAYVLMDEIRLRQILLNLVGNAVKFTDSGIISVKVAARLCRSQSEVNLIINVCDSGIGIASDQKASIFAAFTQQKHQSVKYGGTGLGLTICKRLLELMGGDISVESELGKGSCFTLNLRNVKIVDKSETLLPENENGLESKIDFQPAMVLLVDDLAFNRKLIKAFLEKFKELRIVEAETGEYALSLVKQCHFDLILMDRILPGEDGDTVCRRIKSLPQYATTPIIMITASVISSSEQNFPPAYDFQLDKPVNQKQLLAALQLFLRTKPLIQQATEIGLSTFTEDASKEASTLEQLQALGVVLKMDYQERIATMASSEVFDISTLLEIGEKLAQLAKQYRYDPLYDWATTLKKQAELFDLENVSKTLQKFEVLLAKLQQQC